MTDPELVRKRLAFLQQCVRDLRQRARPGFLATDLEHRRFVEHTLQLAIQAAIDAASHVVSDDKLGEPNSYGDLFVILAGKQILDDDLAGRLRRMAGFRNVLVHGYVDVDLDIVRDVVENRLVDLDDFALSFAKALGLEES